MGYFDDLLPTTQAPQTYIRQGASVISPAKQATATMGTAYRSLLVPTDFLQVSAQGATPEQILVNAWGACGTATGESLTVAGPYLGSQSTDSLGLAIPSAPQPGDSIRVTRFSRTSTRAITHKIAKQKRQAFVQEVTNGKGIIIKQYGTYSYVDSNGVTHQPPGKRDPVVNAPQVGAAIDNDTIKFDANGNMYADLFNQGAADGSGASVATVAGLKAGHGIELIPGFIPTESPTVVVEAGGAVPAGSYSYMYVWLYDTVRTPQSPSVSCTTIDGPPTDYHQPHLTIPGKDDINHATGVELYRKDATVGANGTIQTKFAYTTTPGVLITDGSTGASLITTGAYTGMWQYTADATVGPVEKGYEWEYNPLIRVKAGVPPIPYDPRDGSLTTLIINGAQDGSSVFKTKDGGALNPINGAVTYPQDNPLNHSGFRLVDTLSPQHDPQDYIDTKTDAMLGALYVKQATSINVKPARYVTTPYAGMSPVAGTTPPVWELSGFGFSSDNPAISNDGAYIKTKYGTVLDQENNVSMLLLASPTLPATGTGDQTARFLPGYDTNVYNESAIEFTGAGNRFARVKIDGTTIKQTATGALMAVGGGGGGGGGAAGLLFVAHADGSSPSAPANSGGFFGTSYPTVWHTPDIDHSGWVAAGSTGANVVFPASGDYVVSFTMNFDFSGSGIVPGDHVDFNVILNGSELTTEEYPVIDNYANPGHGQFTTPTFTYGITVSAGDILHIGIRNNASTAASIDPQSYLSVWSVGGGSIGTGWSGQTNNGTGVTSGSTLVFDWLENTSDGTWTVLGTDIAFPVSGTYMISAGCSWDSGSVPTSGASTLLIKVNGTIQQGSPPGYANGLRHPPQLVGLSMVTVTTGDILTLSVNNATDVTYDYGGDINIWRVF